MVDEEHREPQTPPAAADNNSYIFGSMAKSKVVVAFLPMHQIGASAATFAKERLSRFPRIRVGMFVEIGAGISNDNNEPDILDWITPLEFDIEQNNVHLQRQDKTGLWLSESEECTQWIS